MSQYTVRTPDQLPALLKAFRKQAGLTQGQLATRLGITQQTLSALERNAHKVSADRLLQLLCFACTTASLHLSWRNWCSAGPSSSWRSPWADGRPRRCRRYCLRCSTAPRRAWRGRLAAALCWAHFVNAPAGYGRGCFCIH